MSERFNATSKEFEVGLASKTDVAQSDAFLNNSKINLNAEKDPILCNHCKRTASNGVRCLGMCVADNDY